MHSMGLSAPDLARWVSTLRGSCVAYCEVEVWDLDRNFVASLDPVSGQVDVNADQAVTRSASLTLRDPDGLLDGLEALHYMLHVRYMVFLPDQITSITVPAGTGAPFGLLSALTRTSSHSRTVTALQTGKTIPCPIFTGPVSAPPTRAGAEVTVSAQDPSMLATLGCYPKTYPKNKVTTTIKAILTECCGEPGPFLFEDVNTHHPDKVTVGWEDKVRPMAQILALADVAGLQFFYNADGRPVLRPEPGGAHPLVSNLDGLVTSDLTYEVSGELVNRYQVAGNKPEFQGAEAAARPHPLAPAALSRSGVPRYYNATDSDDKAKSDKAAEERAAKLLTRALRDLREAVSLTIAPLPNLDPLDVIHVGADRWTADAFSIPVAGGEMTVGYNAVIDPPKARRVPATAVPKKGKKKGRGHK